jgi:hypothetical protein
MRPRIIGNGEKRGKIDKKNFAGGDGRSKLKS